MRKRALLPVALSIQAAAASISVPVRLIRDAIYRDGTLPAYEAGTNNVIRVRAVDLSDWIAATWPRAKIQRQIRRIRENSP